MNDLFDNVDEYRFIGLSDEKVNTNYSSIDYAFYFRTGEVRVCKNGAYLVSGISYKIGDIFQIKRSESNIKFFKNGQLLHTEVSDASKELLVDVSMFSAGAYVTNVKTSFNVIDAKYTVTNCSSGNDGSIDLTVLGGIAPYSIEWDNSSTSEDISNLEAGVYSVTITDVLNNSVEKSISVLSQMDWIRLEGAILHGSNLALYKDIPVSKWNSGAVSSKLISSNTDGAVEYTIGSTKEYTDKKAIGLTRNYFDYKPNNIDYRIYFDERNVKLYNGSTYLGNFGEFTDGDIFKISRNGDRVIYSKNNIELAVVLTDCTVELMAASAVYTPYSSIGSIFCSFTSNDYPDNIKKPDYSGSEITLVAIKDATVDSENPRDTGGENNHITVNADGTVGANQMKSLLQFDFTNIPENAIITNVTLTLSGTDETSPLVHSGQNEMLLQMLDASWDENTVTWNTMPIATGETIELSSFDRTHQDYTVDLTSWAKSWYDGTNINNGIELRIKTPESGRFKESVFVSTENSETFKHPKLEVSYYVPIEVAVKIYAENDANLSNANPSQNYGDDVYIKISSDNVGETERGLLRFDFSIVPNGAVIENAKLKLYSIVDKRDGKSVYINRVKEEWEEETVNWNTKPSTVSTSNEIPTTPEVDNFFEIDVMDLTQEFVNNTYKNNGIALILDDQSREDYIYLASSDNVDEAKRPYVEVLYTLRPLEVIEEIIIDDVRKNGDVNISAVGGVSPYTYKWSNGSTSSKIDNLRGGNYVLTITDAWGSYAIREINVLCEAYVLPGSSSSDDLNWVQSKVYNYENAEDITGSVLSESRTYADLMGRSIQTVSRISSETDKVIAAQTVYDAKSRPVLSTLPAVLSQNTLDYIDKFITNAEGENYNYTDFDMPNGDESTYGSVDDPAPVNPDSPLGKYYSNANTDEPFVATSAYPYSRIEYGTIQPGAPRRASMAGKHHKMGSGHEVESYTLPILTDELYSVYGYSGSVINQNEDDPSSHQADLVNFNKGTPGFKVVKIDSDDKEFITYYNGGGQVIASCLSGLKGEQNIRTATVTTKMNNFKVATDYYEYLKSEGWYSFYDFLQENNLSYDHYWSYLTSNYLGHAHNNYSYRDYLYDNQTYTNYYSSLETDNLQSFESFFAENFDSKYESNIDIHLADGCENSLKLDFSYGGSYSIYDLRTDKVVFKNIRVEFDVDEDLHSRVTHVVNNQEVTILLPWVQHNDTVYPSEENFNNDNFYLSKDYISYDDGIDFAQIYLNLKDMHPSCYRIVHTDDKGFAADIDIKHDINYYNYALNYYDEAGNLKKVVPPAGVDYDFLENSTVEEDPLKHSDAMLHMQHNGGSFYINPTNSISVNTAEYPSDNKVQYHEVNVKLSANVTNVILQNNNNKGGDNTLKFIEVGTVSSGADRILKNVIEVVDVSADGTLSEVKQVIGDKTFIRKKSGDVFYADIIDDKVIRTGDNTSFGTITTTRAVRETGTVLDKGATVKERLKDSRYVYADRSNSLNGVNIYKSCNVNAYSTSSINNFNINNWDIVVNKDLGPGLPVGGGDICAPYDPPVKLTSSITFDVYGVSGEGAGETEHLIFEDKVASLEIVHHVSDNIYEARIEDVDLVIPPDKAKDIVKVRIKLKKACKNSMLFEGVPAIPSYTEFRVDLNVKTKRVDGAPDHKMIKTYKYNSNDQVVELNSPDLGKTEYVYSKDGKVRFTQNSLQEQENKFSYVCYDKIGRVIESGEYNEDITGASLEFVNQSATPASSNVLFVVNNIGPLAPASSAWLTEQKFIEYSKADAAGLTAAIATGYSQSFLMGRVSKTWNDKNTTWYSYDDRGLIKWIVQDIVGLGVKTIDYEYDFLGNVINVYYQKNNSSEYFEHQYTYDADGRLETVETKAMGDTDHKPQANYDYYLHGPIKRVEIAPKKDAIGGLQGIDYVYTINGSLKSINSPRLNKKIMNFSTDPGNDKPTNNGFESDLFGMTLDYYVGDYVRTGGRDNTIYGDDCGTFIGYGNPTDVSKDNFNGNIKAMRWQIKDQNTENTLPEGSHWSYEYEYDELNRLTEAVFGTFAPDNETNRGTNTHVYAEPFPDDLADVASNDVHLFMSKSASIIKNSKITKGNYFNMFGDVKSEVYQSETLKKPEIVLTTNNSNYLNLNSRFIEQWDDTSDNPFTYGDYFTADGEDAYKVWDINYGRIGDDNDPTAFGNGSSKGGNGNISSLSRNSFDESGNVELDKLKYTYDLGTNRLNYVADEASPAANYYGDIGSQSAGNYTYNSIGQMIGNASDGHYMRYNMDGKVEKIYNTEARRSSDTNPGLTYDYNERGNRIKKTSYDCDNIPADILNEAWYVYDLAGNVMSIYEDKQQGVGTKQVEVSVYGSSRIGTATIASDGTIEYYAYELKDHLGNVRVTFKGIDGGGVEMLSYADYYPYGMEMPGRCSISGGYRYGYQGEFAEKDHETGYNAFQLRQYDSRIGRWMVTDPYNQHFSPYLAMGNNPISRVDPDGGWDSQKRIDRRNARCNRRRIRKASRQNAIWSEYSSFSSVTSGTIGNMFQGISTMFSLDAPTTSGVAGGSPVMFGNTAEETLSKDMTRKYNKRMKEIEPELEARDKIRNMEMFANISIPYSGTGAGMMHDGQNNNITPIDLTKSENTLRDIVDVITYLSYYRGTQKQHRTQDLFVFNKFEDDHYNHGNQSLEYAWKYLDTRVEAIIYFNYDSWDQKCYSTDEKPAKNRGRTIYMDFMIVSDSEAVLSGQTFNPTVIKIRVWGLSEYIKIKRQINGENNLWKYSYPF